MHIDVQPSIGLFTPLTIRGVTLPNRIGLSPMCMYSAAPDGRASDWHLTHLASRAAGGAGLVLTEAVAVTAPGRITDGDLGLWNDEQTSALRRIASAISEAGSVPGIQLSHAGRKGGRTVPWSGYQPIEAAVWGPLIGPSTEPFRESWASPLAMTASDIEQTVSAFASSARRAAEAGFRAIELHFAHGYLVHQFLSPLVNNRNDEYGGNLAGRARLAVRIAEAVRSAVGEELVLLARLSVVDWLPAGLTEEDSVIIARWLRSAGIDVVDCSSGAAIDGERVPAAPGYQVGFASRIRRESSVLTAAVGLITQPTEADAVVRRGEADLVLVGRAMLRDPYWPRVAARELEAAADPPIPLPYRRAVERMDRGTQW